MNRLNKMYSKIRNWLESLNENKIVPGLNRMQELMQYLGNPEKELEIIMIGGTNAKGSTSFSLNSTLTKAGIKTGCFTSPHLHSVRERILLGEEFIPIDEFHACLSQIKEITTEFQIKPTYFEVLTATAYHYFNSKKVDYAIMEIGLGGEWDAVNIGQARIAILTTLGLDHEEYLGNTLESIAITKSKIVNDKTVVITGWPREYHKFIPQCWDFNYGKDVNDWIRYVLKVLKLDCSVDIVPIPGRYEIAGNFTLDTMEYAARHKTLVTGSFYTVSAAREFLKLEGYDEL